MIIVETSVFTWQVLELLSDEEYRKLQTVVANRPTAGSIIPGSGGLRKIRWGLQRHGKSGGVRVIYYWAVEQEKVLMLFMYPKSSQADLTPEQVSVLRKIVEAEYP